jgi:hypothetical protein
MSGGGGQRKSLGGGCINAVACATKQTDLAGILWKVRVPGRREWQAPACSRGLPSTTRARHAHFPPIHGKCSTVKVGSDNVKRKVCRCLDTQEMASTYLVDGACAIADTDHAWKRHGVLDDGYLEGGLLCGTGQKAIVKIIEAWYFKAGQRNFNRALLNASRRTSASRRRCASTSDGTASATASIASSRRWTMPEPEH